MESSSSPQPTSEAPTPPIANALSTAIETTGRRRGCELDTRTRIQISTLKEIAGWSYRQIHERFPDLPLSTIKTTCQKIRQRESIETQKRTGRPKILDAEDRLKLIQKIKEDPYTSYKNLLDMVGNKCTARVITRFFAEEKIDVHKLRAAKRPPAQPTTPNLALVSDGAYISQMSTQQPTQQQKQQPAQQPTV
ncbi:Transposable element tc3 transposase [Penicillium angulare]|uniref:Transposable element tc3 transposase n=1 Tax=Penicillium angulare TaxID=116970 RepID=A0A9W9JZ93_9EURO|nr:Transposable element tc3 transposase [Penicillium angulare]